MTVLIGICMISRSTPNIEAMKCLHVLPEGLRRLDHPIEELGGP
jgi:hypothetical protein